MVEKSVMRLIYLELELTYLTKYINRLCTIYITLHCSLAVGIHAKKKFMSFIVFYSMWRLCGLDEHIFISIM